MYVCPRCGRVSSNPNDERERYCGACGSEDGMLPKGGDESMYGPPLDMAYQYTLHSQAREVVLAAADAYAAVRPGALGGQAAEIKLGAAWAATGALYLKLTDLLEEFKRAATSLGMPLELP